MTDIPIEPCRGCGVPTRIDSYCTTGGCQGREIETGNPVRVIVTGRDAIHFSDGHNRWYMNAEQPPDTPSTSHTE